MNGNDQKSSRKIFGILSNSQHIHEYSHFRGIIQHYMENDIGIIYICHGMDVGKSIYNHFKDILGDKFQGMRKKGQISILSKKRYIDQKIYMGDAFYRKLVLEINKMQDNSFTELRIYINMGSEVNFVAEEDLEEMYECIFRLIKLYKLKVIMRFFMDEITNFNFFATLAEVGGFVVEDIKNKDFLLDRFSQIITSPRVFPAYMHKDEGTGKEAMEENSSTSSSDVDQIIDEIAHDFKNIFATISGYTQLAMLKTDSKEVKEYLGIILNNCLDSHMIAEGFKSSSKNKENRSIYDFNLLIRNISEMTLNMNKSKLDLNNNSISILYSLSSQRNIYCNRYEIQQVVMNIINNGIQAISGKGYIIINTYDHRDTTILEIIDNGKGIDNVTLDKIFKPYYTTKKRQGSRFRPSYCKKNPKGAWGNNICRK